MKDLIDKVVCEFSKSGYPRCAFYYSDESLEIEIRLAHNYPLEIQSFKASSDFNPREHYLPLHLICPAIEVIEIKDPSLRNKGLFSYLVTKLLTLDDVEFIVVQNVHSLDFANNLYQSKRWKPILSPCCLNETKIKRMIPLLRAQPKQFECIKGLLQEYIDEFEPSWCKEALESINKLISSKGASDNELIGANKPEPPRDDSLLARLAYDASVTIYEDIIPDDRRIAVERGESLATYYGKSVFECYYTTKELSSLPL